MDAVCFLFLLQFNYYDFQFIELIGLNIFLIQKYILDKLIHKLSILMQKYSIFSKNDNNI